MPTLALQSISDPFYTVKNSIPYFELHQTSERMSMEGTEWVRRLACMFKDRVTFITDMLGDARTVAGQLRRDLPESHPWSARFLVADMQLVSTAGYPDFDTANNDGLTFTDYPDSGTSPVTGEGLAIYDVTYRPPALYDVKSDEDIDNGTYGERERYVITTDEPAAENLPVPRGLLYFEDDSLQTPVDIPAIPVPTVIFNLQWLRVPIDVQMPQTWYGYWDGSKLVPGFVGSINSTDFWIPRRGLMLAGTLLGLPPHFRPYVDANTNEFNDITFQMQYRPQGHNRFRKNNGCWKKLLVKDVPSACSSADQTGVFPEFEFKNIFDVSRS